MEQHRNYSQGRKGQKLPRINMAFYGDNLQYVKEASYRARQSITEYINQLIADDRQQLCQKATAASTREYEPQAEDHENYYEELLAKTQKLELDLKQEKEISRNYRKHILWLRTSNDKKPSPAPCPFCGSTNVELEGCVDDRIFFVQCHDCEALGPEADHENKAILAWNKAATRSSELLIENCRLKSELETAKKFSQNYWKHIVWMRTSEDFKPKASPCPICGSEHVGLEGSVCCRKFFVWCLDCDAMGPEADGEANAIRAWNKGDKVTRFDDEEDEPDPDEEGSKPKHELMEEGQEK